MWKAPETVHQPDFMADGGWEKFRKDLNKKYRELGLDGGMREVMDMSIAEAVSRRGRDREVARARRKREMDAFFENLKQPLTRK